MLASREGFNTFGFEVFFFPIYTTSLPSDLFYGSSKCHSCCLRKHDRTVHHFYDGTVLNRKGRRKEGVFFFHPKPLKKCIFLNIKSCYCTPPLKSVYKKLSRLCNCSKNLQKRPLTDSISLLAAKEYWLLGAKIVLHNSWKLKDPNPFKLSLPFKFLSETTCQNHEPFSNELSQIPASILEVSSKRFWIVRTTLHRSWKVRIITFKRNGCCTE